jgi:hypothetical protein
MWQPRPAADASPKAETSLTESRRTHTQKSPMQFQIEKAPEGIKARDLANSPSRSCFTKSGNTFD